MYVGCMSNKPVFLSMISFFVSRQKWQYKVGIAAYFRWYSFSPAIFNKAFHSTHYFCLIMHNKQSTSTAPSS